MAAEALIYLYTGSNIVISVLKGTSASQRCEHQLEREQQLTDRILPVHEIMGCCALG